MAWWSEYKGIYRIRAEVDTELNDYPREFDGSLCQEDVYIECSCGKIYWAGHSTFEAWVGYEDNSGRSRAQKLNNIIKDNKDIIIKDSIFKGDGEGTFQFKKVNLPAIVSAMGGDYKSAISRSPFSSKNLCKSDYEIPESDSNKLKDAFAVYFDKIYGIDKWYSGVKAENGKTRVSIKLYNEAYENFLISEKGIKKYKDEMKLNKLNVKQYIHKNGYFDEFLEYIEKLE